MATLKKYNLEGKETGTLSVSDTLSNAEASGQLVKDYIVAIRANARQWSACVKNRAEVSHTTKKTGPQKGSGGARHGSLVAPQFRGGGRAFGPKPKFNQHVSINKKERLAAIRSLIAEKIKSDKLKIIETTGLDAPKTKTMVNFLENSGCKGRTLFIGQATYAEVKENDQVTKVAVKSDAHTHLTRSLRNIPKIQFSLAKNISGYDVIIASQLVMTEEALNEVTEWLC